MVEDVEHLAAWSTPAPPQPRWWWHLAGPVELWCDKIKLRICGTTPNRLASPVARLRLLRQLAGELAPR